MAVIWANSPAGPSASGRISMRCPSPRIRTWCIPPESRRNARLRHDFHTAALLGAAELLQNRRRELVGTVKLFFQPDEEGDGGAARMIAAGCMEEPHVDAALCVHVESGIPTGTLTVKAGPICASSNPFAVTLRGRGTHGAKPHLGTDVITAGAQIISALQTSPAAGPRLRSRWS